MEAYRRGTRVDTSRATGAVTSIYPCQSFVQSLYIFVRSDADSRDHLRQPLHIAVVELPLTDDQIDTDIGEHCLAKERLERGFKELENPDRKLKADEQERQAEVDNLRAE